MKSRETEPLSLACHLGVRETLRCEPKIGDLRTAGFVLSINKGSVVYEERGISSVTLPPGTEDQEVRRLRIDFAPTARASRRPLRSLRSRCLLPMS